jgi:cytochrome c oxidase subunit III
MSDAAMTRPLPVGSIDRRSSGWYGVLCLIATEGALFGYLLFSYFYCAVQFPPSWSPEPHPPFTYSLPATIVMLLSSAAIWWGEQGLKTRALTQHRIGLAAAIALGVLFLGLEGLEWESKSFSLTSGLYGSLYFTITGIDMVHLAIGILGLAAVLIWSALGYFDTRHDAPVVIIAAYWHFVTLVWIAVFITLYVTPYLR